MRETSLNAAFELSARKMACLLLAGAAIGVVPTAQASHTCTVSVSTENFGAYSGVQINTSATMTVTCTLVGSTNETANFTATLSTGAGTYAQRLVTHSGPPADTLKYNLYKTTVPGTLNTSVWGDGSGGTVTWASSISMTTGSRVVSKTLTVAAALAAVAAIPTAGTYNDTITVTVTYT